jgi:hypothetical protein
MSVVETDEHFQARRRRPTSPRHRKLHQRVVKLLLG